MLKKTVTYTDFFGAEQTDELYFHLPKAELIELSLDEGDILHKLSTLTAEAKNGAKIISFFKTFLLRAYGERSEDGKRFVKDEQIQKEFSQTAAFDKLLLDLVTYKEDPVEFIKGVLPPDLAKAAEEKMNEQKGLPQDFRKKA